MCIQEEIKSLEDAIKVFTKTHNKFYGSPREACAWYRGQAKDWPLLPGIMRYDYVKVFSEYEQVPPSLLEVQRYLFQKFVKLSAGLRSKEYSDPVSLYFLAQHYGLPSFLLDWTIYPLVALFFAVENESIPEDGVLYAITPKLILYKYPVFEQRDPFIKSCIANILNEPALSDKEKEDYYKITAKMEEDLKKVYPKIPKPIISIIPNKTNYRIDKQGARFLLYFEKANSLAPEDCIIGMTKYFIPQQYKLTIKEQLKAFFGISYGYIFGDMDSIVKEVKWTFKVHN